MRTMKRVLRHPVTGELYQFTLGSKADYDTFTQTRNAWSAIEQKGKSGGQDATAVQPPSLVNQMQTSGEMATGVVPPDRAVPRASLTDEQSLRSMSPALAAMLASLLVPPMRYGAMARMGLSGLAGAAAAPIAGTDPMTEARNQMLMSLPGEVAAGAFGAAGRGAIRKGIGAAPELRAGFGDVGGVAARERLGVANPRTLAQGPEPAGVGEKLLGNTRKFTGSKGAEESLNELRPRIQSVLANDPTTHRLSDVLSEARNGLGRRIGRQPLRTEQLDEVDNVLRKIANENFATMDNLAAWEMKRGAQDASVELLKRNNKPLTSSAEAAAKSDIEQQVNKELQQVLNNRLKNIKGYRALATRYQELEGVRRALLDAETGMDATASARAVAGATSPRVAFNPEGMLSPQAMTTIGRTLDHPVTNRVVANVPRVLQEWARMNDPTFEATDILAGKKK